MTLKISKTGDESFDSADCVISNYGWLHIPENCEIDAIGRRDDDLDLCIALRIPGVMSGTAWVQSSDFEEI